MSCFATADIALAATAAQISVNGGASEAPLLQLADNSSTPAWAAPAQMNPDYKKDEAPAAAAADVPQPPTGGQATTSYFGGDEQPKNPAWAAPAEMNADYSKTATAAPSPGAASAASAPTLVRDVALESCRSEISAEAAAAKLYFANGSAELGSGEKAGLEKIAKAAAACGNVVIEVGGHADSTGNVAANKALSEHRAKAVVAFLTHAGVDAGKLKAVGYGQANPITTNGTAEGRRLNRRIEFLVTSH
jgi:outer membrane protein OmpA-like peptidoglycan-associated protein